MIYNKTIGPPDHPSTQGSPQVNLDCITPQPFILEDLDCKPQKVRDTSSLLVILQDPLMSTLYRIDMFFLFIYSPVDRYNPP